MNVLANGAFYTEKCFFCDVTPDDVRFSPRQTLIDLENEITSFLAGERPNAHNNVESLFNAGSSLSQSRDIAENSVAVD